MVLLKFGRFRQETYVKLYVDIQVLNNIMIDSVNSVNYDKTGKYLASSSSDLTVRLWDNSN